MMEEIMAETNAVIIDDKDNVAVVVEPVKKGDQIAWLDKEKNRHEINALEDITIFHKVAIKEIPADQPVVKYGEHIGLAATEIKTGEHVHEHNVKNHREKL
jgi:altronate dehydratase small subunit